MSEQEDLEALAEKLGIPVDTLVAAIQESGSLPERERQRYRDSGFEICEPDQFMGELLSLSPRDWLPPSFLAIKGKEVQISVIAARQPGSGAFSRLLARLDTLGYRVRVVAPLPQMAAILKAMGEFARSAEATRRAEANIR